MKIAVILGTRPEIIKMSPVIRELQAANASFCIVHTGQHYAKELDLVFFEQLRLPPPSYNLEVGSGSHAEQTARILARCERALVKERPDIVLVEGDTNSVLAGALAAAKLHIPVGHVEAGLRSYDRRMPEEINRVLTDHCSDFLFAPTARSRAILRGEGIPEEKIFITGNTIVDAVRQNLELSRGRHGILGSLGTRPQGFFLATVHRQENVDDRRRFASILQGLRDIAAEYGCPVVYPVHPRSRKRLAESGYTADDGLRLIDPVDYLDFLKLEASARLILTDSGGVQEEACILGIPCVTLRDNTERPETIEAGANMLAGVSPGEIRLAAAAMLRKDSRWENPFGAGDAAQRILRICNAATGRALAPSGVRQSPG
ncbi:MAG: UDP-N-acetylglucosamine 2-epimerase (non-hydrolyzing) [Chloroflexi bacterium]|nr:UDP-N-acetylglucosamine 2-epimerase (non-hydrolyzing) [Chloroflexota bacterium]